VEENKTEMISKKEFIHRRALDLKQSLEQEKDALLAKVIYRNPHSWGSSLWISVGWEDNERLEKPIVCKNSPVLASGYLVGVIDSVEKKRSKVRLITDSGLVIAVRAVRGTMQDEELALTFDKLKKLLHVREDLYELASSFDTLYQYYKELKTDPTESLYLAKGELYGNSCPIWGMKDPILRGVGFQYEYGDEESEARDLKTGALRGREKDSAVPLIQKGDILITSGLDGVFPKGLKIAFVDEVEPLKEEDYFYRIKARPLHPKMVDLNHLLVLPPIEPLM
jgi:rod shape-determining protein MreC